MNDAANDSGFGEPDEVTNLPGYPTIMRWHLPLNWMLEVFDSLDPETQDALIRQHDENQSTVEARIRVGNGLVESLVVPRPKGEPGSTLERLHELAYLLETFQDAVRVAIRYLEKKQKR